MIIVLAKLSIVFITVAAIVIVINLFSSFWKFENRTYASKYIPIIASVSEHQPPTWPSYFMDINVLAFLVPAGIIVSSQLFILFKSLNFMICLVLSLLL